MFARVRQWTVRAALMSLRAVALFVACSVVQVTLVRFVDPPATLTMLERARENFVTSGRVLGGTQDTLQLMGVGTDIGVFYTDADQIDWKTYGLGMPAVYVLDLKIRQFTRKLYAGTHGRGVYSVDMQTLVGTDAPTAAMPETRVYPNPTRNVLLFKSATEQVFEGKIELYDAMGRRAIQKNVVRQPLDELVLDVAALPAGLYFLQTVNSEGRMVVREKVVISD
jgi:hypothetical protein